VTTEVTDAVKTGAQVPVTRGRRPSRPFVPVGLQKRVVEAVQSVCGLTSLRPGRGLARNNRAVVWFGRKSEPTSRDDIIPLGDLSVGVLMGEKDGEWLRFVQLGGYLIDGHVLIGGGAFDLHDSQAEHLDDEALNGWEGLWTTPAGKTYLRCDLPKDYEGSSFPEGLYKDVSAPPWYHSRSLFATQHHVAQSNMKSQRVVHHMLSLVAENLRKKIEPFDSVQAPGILTAVDQRMRLRAMDGTFGTHRDAEELDQITVDCLQLGAWVIPQLQDRMVPKLDEHKTAIVKSVSLNAVYLDTGDAGLCMITPTTEVRQFIHRMTGMDATELVVVPLVTRGQLVSRDTCVFGPEMPQLFSVTSLQRRIEKCENSEEQTRLQRLTDLERIWALLTLATEHNHMLLYPVQYVVPSSPRQVFIRRTWGSDLSLQLVRLERAPLKLLKVTGSGYRINLWNTSHREAQKKAFRERRDREAAEAREAAKAAQQS